MEVLITIPTVPESNAIKLAESHVIALNLTNQLPILPYFTKHIILVLHSGFIKVKEAIKLILYVMILDWAMKLVSKCTVKYVVKEVIVMIMPDCLAVSESNLLVP